MQQPGTTHSAPDEPLSFAVHALPDIVSPDFVEGTPTGRGKLLAILFACVLPLLVLALFFSVAQPAGQARFGIVIDPARAVPDITLQNLAGQPVALAGASVASGTQDVWHLIGVGPSRCEDRCVKHVFIQRQLREMLLKQGVQVERRWLLTDDGTPAEPLTRLLQDAQVLRATPAQVTQWLGMVPADAGAQLFIEDPQGKLVLRMPADQDSAQVRAAMWTLQQLIAARAVASQPVTEH
jgi:hypothetical protein